MLRPFAPEFKLLFDSNATYLPLFQGIAGSAVLKYITPEEKRGSLGATVPAPGVTAGQALGIEILLTFLLVFTVCASTDPKRNHYGYEVPLSIGLCVAVCHFIGVSLKTLYHFLCFCCSHILKCEASCLSQRFFECLCIDTRF